MSSTSVCRMSGLNPLRMASTSARVGWRVTATQASLRRAAAASSLARATLTSRTEDANTKPMASTSQASAAFTASARGHAAELDEQLAHALAPALALRAETAARPAASMAPASFAGSAADMSALPTSARS